MAFASQCAALEGLQSKYVGKLSLLGKLSQAVLNMPVS